jgi:ribonuclease-3
MGLEVFSQRLGVTIDPTLLQQALTHRSYSYEHDNAPNNERLEFLGDSVLGFVVTSHIFEKFPHLAEGELTKIKNGVVSAKALAEVGIELGLGEHLVLGKGEESSGGRKKANLIADAVEAILGAVYLDAGLPAAAAIIERYIFPLLEDHLGLLENSDPKTQLLEIAQAQNLGQPNYENTFEGPDHDRDFKSTVTLGHVVATGSGRSRKAAEAIAAANALKAFGAN